MSTGPAVISGSVTRRTLLRVLGLTALIPAAAACQSTELPVYRLASAELNGFFYEFAQLLADAVARDNAPFRLERVITLGTMQNLQMLRDGEMPLALALADATVADPNGRVALGRVYENYLQVVVPNAASINGIEDLPGHRVSLGFPGSGTENSAKRVLAAAGIDPNQLTLVPVPLVELLDALATGRVEAGFFAGGVPNPVVDPASGRGPSGGLRILSLSRPLRVLQQQFGTVYQSVIVPAGVYGAATEVETVGITSLVLAEPDLPDDVAERIVDVMLRRAGELIPGPALGAQYLSASSLIYTFGIPLHPGAAAAYRTHHG
jgi:TRAP transporter TAXI family solute receptor